ncbi:MAG TPA: glutathione S-transferase family protein [Burkholderiales bacterium]|nr:glutathione S-transferase family protein [Burkholderiales bacterium]
MIDLYAAGTSNGMRARIALEECGLQYRWHPVDLMKGENRSPEFLKLNPNAQIPVIVDDAAPGGKQIVLSQSSAIMIYCAEKAGKFMPSDPVKRAMTLEAYMSASTDITPMFGTVNGILRSKEPHAPTANMFRSRLREYFKVWNDKLAQRRYAAGDDVTIADFSLYAGYWRTKGALPDVVAELPNLERWAGEVAARPAIQRAVKL